jgi:thioesterase domain-containing protein
MADKVLIKAQDIKRERGAFIRNWIEHKRNWANYQRTRSDALQAPAKTVELHNERVHSAFLRALDLYEVKPYDGQVLLLRPKLEPRYLVTGGRQLNADRGFVRHDNGWSPLAPNLDVIEVPGDHDSMVLNPNVRVLSDKVRQHLKLCDQRVVSISRPIAAE